MTKILFTENDDLLDIRRDYAESFCQRPLTGRIIGPRGAHANLKVCYCIVRGGFVPRRDYAESFCQRPLTGRIIGPHI
jgi:hypothetical protein